MSNSSTARPGRQGGSLSAPAKPLNSLERTELRNLTKRIKQSSEQIVEDLCTIKTKRLFREHGSFKSFVQAELPFSRRRAYQLIQDAEIRANLCTAVHTLPASEWQARPLARLKDPAQQIACWQDILDETNNSPTTADVEAKVEVYLQDDEAYEEPAAADDTTAPPLGDTLNSAWANHCQDTNGDDEPAQEVIDLEADKVDDVEVAPATTATTPSPDEKRRILWEKTKKTMSALIRGLDDLDIPWQGRTLSEVRAELWQQ